MKFALLVVVLVVAGCGGPAPLRGGRAAAVSRPAGGVEQTVVQSENPAAESRQDQESVRVKTYTVPAASQMVTERVIDAVTNRETVVLAAAMPVVDRVETRAKTELGAAQKDTAREIGAKLASLRGIVWVGVVLFLAGLATLFYPPLRAIVGSVTTSAAICAGGLALMVLPTLIVGNEVVILAVVALSVGGWFIAHRYGKLRGLVEGRAPPGS
jgi:hypothetical protein